MTSYGNQCLRVQHSTSDLSTIRRPHPPKLEQLPQEHETLKQLYQNGEQQPILAKAWWVWSMHI